MAAMATEEMNEYELKRLENIKRNTQMIASLKIHSHISDLSASSKRFREEKSYKVSSEKKKPKSEGPVVIRRSLRTRGMPPDTPGLPETFNDSSIKPSKSSPMKVSSIIERVPMPLEPLGLDQTYEGAGSHLALLQKLGRLTSMAQSSSRETSISNSCTEFSRVKLELEKPITPWSVKLEEDNVVPAVPGKRNTQSATRKTHNSDSSTEFGGVKSEVSMDPHLLKLEDDNAVPSVTGGTKNQPDTRACNSKYHTEFERVKLEEPINPRSFYIVFNLIF